MDILQFEIQAKGYEQNSTAIDPKEYDFASNGSSASGSKRSIGVG
jgi:hypothetical protein